LRLQISAFCDDLLVHVREDVLGMIPAQAT